MTDTYPEIAVVCVMAKAPVAGMVKTRLCPPLDPHQAADVARAFLIDTWTSVASVPHVRTALAYAGPRAAFPTGLRPSLAFEQCGVTLGERIEHAVNHCLAQADVAVVVGSDVPGLTPHRITTAIAELDNADVVLGPSRDGGFYLLGTRCPLRDILVDITWSSPLTWTQTMARLVDAGCAVTEVAAFDDVDEFDDLVMLRDRLQTRSVVAPATRACLEALSCASLL